MLACARRCTRASRAPCWCPVVLAWEEPSGFLRAGNCRAVVLAAWPAPPGGGPAADAGSVHYFCRVLAEPVPVG